MKKGQYRNNRPTQPLGTRKVHFFNAQQPSPGELTTTTSFIASTTPPPLKTTAAPVALHGGHSDSIALGLGLGFGLGLPAAAVAYAQMQKHLQREYENEAAQHLQEHMLDSASEPGRDASAAGHYNQL